jgi:hypothetical protein
MSANIQVGTAFDQSNPAAPRVTPTGENISVSTPIEPARLPHQANFVARLGMLIGRAIEARASEVLAIDARQQPLATIIAEPAGPLESIEEELQLLRAEVLAEAASHSAQQASRIAKIAERLRGPVLSAKWLVKKAAPVSTPSPST